MAAPVGSTTTVEYQLASIDLIKHIRNVAEKANQGKEERKEKVNDLYLKTEKIGFERVEEVSADARTLFADTLVINRKDFKSIKELIIQLDVAKCKSQLKVGFVKERLVDVDPLAANERKELINPSIRAMEKLNSDIAAAKTKLDALRASVQKIIHFYSALSVNQPSVQKIIDKNPQHSMNALHQFSKSQVREQRNLLCSINAMAKQLGSRPVEVLAPISEMHMTMSEGAPLSWVRHVNNTKFPYALSDLKDIYETDKPLTEEEKVAAAKVSSAKAAARAAEAREAAAKAATEAQAAAQAVVEAEAAAKVAAEKAAAEKSAVEVEAVRVAVAAAEAAKSAAAAAAAEAAKVAVAAQAAAAAAPAAAAAAAASAPSTQPSAPGADESTQNLKIVVDNA